MSPSASKWCVRLFWAVPLSFYFYTVCRWPGWIDAPMIAGSVYRLQLNTWVNTHNLFHLLGRVWTLAVPFGDLHARLNFFCAFLGAVTVYFVFLTGLKVTRNLLASVAGAVAVMFGHSLWWHSTILEVYTLNTALLSIFLYLIAAYEEGGEKNRLYGAFFVFGLACTNHVLMGLFVFAFAAILFVPPRCKELWRPKTLGLLAFFFFMGFSLYAFLFCQEFNRRLTESGTAGWKSEWDILKIMIDGATGGHFKRAMFPVFMTPAQKWHWKLNYLFLLFMNYPSVAFIAGWVGLVAFAKNKNFRLTFVFFAVGIVVQAFWSSNYLIWDMYAFGLPVWILFGFATVLGFDALLKSRPAVKLATLCLLPTLLVGPIVYQNIPGWARTAGFWKNYLSSFDYVSNLWEPAAYLANPNKRHYDDVEKIADAVFAILPQGAHLYDDDGKGYYPLALYYQNVLKRRPDLHHHMIFGPELNDQVAFNVAKDMADNLEKGEAVYISSPYWPERPILNQLYDLLNRREAFRKGEMDTAKKGASFSVSNLENTFPKYELRRIPLIEGKPFFIYRLVPRGS